MIELVVRNGHQKDMYYDETQFFAQIEPPF